MPIYKLVLPSMGESISEATITQWLKKVGDTVNADEAVVEVATDKVDSEVASEYRGIIKEILHPINAVVSVDVPLLKLRKRFRKILLHNLLQMEFLLQQLQQPRRLK